MSLSHIPPFTICVDTGQVPPPLCASVGYTMGETGSFFIEFLGVINDRRLVQCLPQCLTHIEHSVTITIVSIVVTMCAC